MKSTYYVVNPDGTKTAHSYNPSKSRALKKLKAEEQAARKKNRRKGPILFFGFNTIHG